MDRTGRGMEKGGRELKHPIKAGTEMEDSCYSVRSSHLMEIGSSFAVHERVTGSRLELTDASQS